MFSCFLPNKKSKGNLRIPLKIWDSDRKKRIGIVSSSLSELELIIKAKFEVGEPEDVRLVFEQDGTDIDEEEIFSELEGHSVVMVLVGNQTWTPVVAREIDRVEDALSALLDSNRCQHAARLIEERIQKERDPRMLEILGQLVTSMGQNISAESREHDPEWFKDIPQSRTTKCAVMRDCAKRRVRKYYNTALDHIKTTQKRKVPEALEEVFDSFQKELTSNDYNGDYFDRSSPVDSGRFCDDSGWFRCEGPYNMDKCPSFDHQINPYGSKANYLVFSTWNLDHQVEKSREVLPCLLHAYHKKPKRKKLNWTYFYQLLFTRNNLKIVHTSCHDKREHESLKCDPKMFYTS